MWRCECGGVRSEGTIAGDNNFIVTRTEKEWNLAEMIQQGIIIKS